jgi:hypothetical protein
MTLHGPAAVLLGTALLAAAACGGSASGPKVASVGGGAASTPRPAAPVNTSQLYVQFAHCVRQHGGTEPDPTFDAQGNRIWQVKVDSIPTAEKQPCMPLLQRAFQARGGPLQTGPPTQAQLAAEVEFSQCMRQHGVPGFPDPDPSTGQFKGVNPQDPTLQAAYSSCRSLLPQGVG